jgi:hypothetical protein
VLFEGEGSHLRREDDRHFRSCAPEVARNRTIRGVSGKTVARGREVQEQQVDIYNTPAVVVVVYSSCERVSRRVGGGAGDAVVEGRESVRTYEAHKSAKTRTARHASTTGPLTKQTTRQRWYIQKVRVEDGEMISSLRQICRLFGTLSSCS